MLVTILILIDGFLQSHGNLHGVFLSVSVTILILIDGFLQSPGMKREVKYKVLSQSLF